MTARVAVSGLTVSFGDSVAVDDVSFALERGEILGLVGESGSGKTTIARAVVGFQVPTSGLIELDGAPVGGHRTAQQRRHAQLVFQDPYASLNPRRTVRSILTELLRAHSLASGRAAITARCEQLMTLVQLPVDSLDAYPSQFSGGQRQRLAIARALAVEPHVLIADEPTSALDVSVQATILDLIERLRDELGLSVLIITHDLGVVARLCDRVAVLQAGRMLEISTAPDFFAGPATDYGRRLLAAAPRLDRTPLA